MKKYSDKSNFREIKFILAQSLRVNVHYDQEVRGSGTLDQLVMLSNTLKRQRAVIG